MDDKAEMNGLIKNVALIRGHQLLKEKFDDDKNLLRAAYKSALHDEIFEALKDSGILPYIVFQGGTCLQRVYGLPRLSEDLDFCYSSFNDYENFLLVRQNLKSSLMAVFQDKLNFPAEHIQITSPTEFVSGEALGNKVEKWKMKIVISERGQKQALHVEIANIASLDYEKKIIPSIVETGVHHFGNVESLNELYSDKAIALCFRPYIKYRDVFDITFLTGKRQSLDAALFFQKLKGYHIKNPLPLIEEKLQALQYTPETQEHFLFEMSRFISEKALKHLKEDVKDYLDLSTELCTECLELVKENPSLTQKETPPAKPSPSQKFRR